MEDKELIEQLKDLGNLAKVDENYKIRTRWHLERLVKTSKLEKKALFGFLPAKKGLVSALMVSALVLGGGGATAALAEKSYPGDTLYPVKRFIEDTRIFLVRNPKLRVKLRQLFIRKRFNELKKLLPAGEIKDISPRQRKALIELMAAIDKLKQNYIIFKEDGLDKQEIKILLEDYKKIENRVKKEAIRKKFLKIRQELLELQKSSY